MGNSYAGQLTILCGQTPVFHARAVEAELAVRRPCPRLPSGGVTTLTDKSENAHTGGSHASLGTIDDSVNVQAGVGIAIWVQQESGRANVCRRKRREGEDRSEESGKHSRLRYSGACAPRRRRSSAIYARSIEFGRPWQPVGSGKVRCTATQGRSRAACRSSEAETELSSASQTSDRVLFCCGSHSRLPRDVQPSGVYSNSAMLSQVIAKHVLCVP